MSSSSIQKRQPTSSTSTGLSLPLPAHLKLSLPEVSLVPPTPISSAPPSPLVAFVLIQQRFLPSPRYPYPLTLSNSVFSLVIFATWKFLPDLSKRLRLIAPLKKNVKFSFTPASGTIVQVIFSRLAQPPILVFPDWDLAADGTRYFYLYCDARIDSFNIVLEQR